jgi:hypothetical protein
LPAPLRGCQTTAPLNDWYLHRELAFVDDAIGLSSIQRKALGL